LFLINVNRENLNENSAGDCAGVRAAGDCAANRVEVRPAEGPAKGPFGPPRFNAGAALMSSLAISLLARKASHS